MGEVASMKIETEDLIIEIKAKDRKKCPSCEKYFLQKDFEEAK